MTDYLGAIKDMIIGGRHKEIEAVVKAAIDDSVNLKSIIDDAMIAAMDVVGEKFKNYEVYLPGLIVTSRAMKAGLVILKPILADSGTS